MGWGGKFNESQDTQLTDARGTLKNLATAARFRGLVDARVTVVGDAMMEKDGVT